VESAIEQANLRARFKTELLIPSKHQNPLGVVFGDLSG
jgi:hypothetical protein